MNERETIVGEVRKSTAEIVRVSVGEFKGRVYCHARIWAKEEGGTDEAKPTVKGLTIRPDVLRELLPLLKTAVDAAEKMDEGDEGSGS